MPRAYNRSPWNRLDTTKLLKKAVKLDIIGWREYSQWTIVLEDIDKKTIRDMSESS